MPLTITHVGGPNDGLVQTFNDTVDSIAIGRDPEQCDVVLDPDARMAGREHCTLARVRGKYIIDMAPNRIVTLGDGTMLDSGTPIPDWCELIIGPNGPKLRAV
jgi:predicted component of type VI protein secretion system